MRQLFIGWHCIFVISPNSFQPGHVAEVGWNRILEELNHKDKAWRCCILWFVNIHDRPCYRPIKLTFILLVQKDTKYIISVGHNSDLNLTTWQENYIFKKIKGPFASTKISRQECILLWHRKVLKLHNFSLFNRRTTAIKVYFELFYFSWKAKLNSMFWYNSWKRLIKRVL